MTHPFGLFRQNIEDKLTSVKKLSQKNFKLWTCCFSSLIWLSRNKSVQKPRFSRIVKNSQEFSVPDLDLESCAWSIWTWPRLKDLITVYTTSSPLHRNEKVNIYHSLWGNPILQHFGDGEVNSCFLFFSMLCWTLQLRYLPWRLRFMVLFMFDKNITKGHM